MEGSIIYQILGLLTISFAVCNGDGYEGMSVNAESSNVKPGDDIKISCDFADGSFVAGDFVEWYKYGQDENDKVKFAINQNIEDLFHAQLPDKEKDSFVLNANNDNGVHFKVTIKNAKIEHSGRYVCKLASQNPRVEESITIQVLREPSVIALFVDNIEITNDMEVEMESVKTERVRCVASGGNPAPQIRMFAGPDMEITRKFGRNAFNHEIIYSDGDIAGFPYRDGKTTLEGDLELTSQYSNEDLYCDAVTPGLDEDVLTSHKYHIKFAGTPPEIMCSQLMVVKKPNEKSVSINCTVTANPELDHSSVSFPRVQHDNKTIVLTAGEKFGSNMKFHTEVDPEDHERTYLILTIDNMFPQMFRTYIFTATNSIDSAHANITLERDPDYEEEASSVAMLSVSLATVFIIVLTTLLL